MNREDRVQIARASGTGLAVTALATCLLLGVLGDLDWSTAVALAMAVTVCGVATYLRTG